MNLEAFLADICILSRNISLLIFSQICNVSELHFKVTVFEISLFLLQHQTSGPIKFTMHMHVNDKQSNSSQIIKHLAIFYDQTFRFLVFLLYVQTAVGTLFCQILWNSYP